MHCKVEEPDVIKYADVTSLYPWVNKSKEYPVRFPIVYTNPSDQDMHHYFGIALVEILPPQYLFHPVRTPLQSWWQTQVPAMCSLCERTAEKPWLQRTNLCSQTDDERKLRGTWATVELVKAVELGYRILKIHEVFHFLEEQRKVVLFEDYVNSWLKIKQESAGWPDGCKKKNKPTLLIMPKKKGFNWSMWQKTRAGNSWQK